MAIASVLVQRSLRGRNCSCCSASGDDGGANRGAVWILFLDNLGNVRSHDKISDLSGDLPPGGLDDGDQFGISIASLGDLDGDGPSDHALAVGARLDDDGGANRGAAWILFLDVDTENPIVTVDSHHKISDLSGDLPDGEPGISSPPGTAPSPRG